jgi:hypothetical protein
MNFKGDDFMLKDILRKMDGLEGFSKSAIALDFHISEEMVEDLLGQLVRMNYLKENLGSPSCETSCGKCPYAKVCHTVPVKMYSITDKGKNLLNQAN